MFIYKTVNLVNNMIYIGQSHKPKEYYLGSGTRLKEAIRKYGRNNFRKEIIEEGIETQEELDDRETFWVKFYHSDNPSIGYNICCGGTGTPQGIKYLKNATSKYVGVYWSIVNNAWRARIKYKTKNYHLGQFDIEENAALAYNIAAKKFYGDDAHLNDLSITEFIIGESRTPGKRKNCSSNFVGVSWDNEKRKWVAQVYVGKVSKFIGRFATEKEAARAYNKRALELYGDNAKLNVIEDDDE